MWTKQTEEKRLRQYNRLMLRSAFVSVFWNAISERRRHGKFTLQKLAELVRRSKSAVSRWFSNEPPNWTIDTISDIAEALDLELSLQATHRQTGVKFSAGGAQTVTASTNTLTDTSPTPKVPVRIKPSGTREAASSAWTRPHPIGAVA